MKILVSGASGMIGSALGRELTAAGRLLSVALVRGNPEAGEILWNPAEPLDPQKLRDFDAVVHLSGKNIAGLWTQKFKQEVADSRLQSTRTLALAAAESFRRYGKPGVFLCASAIGYYGNRGDERLTEDSGPGSGFVAELGQAWEAATDPARDAGLRVVNLRIGIVLARQGGALKTMLPVFRMGLGGPTGSGRQYMSWITLDDVTGAILFALQDGTVRGPVNVVAPNPVRNADFVHVLAKELHRPALLPVPSFAVRTLFGQMGEELLLGSLRVEPARLQAAGYPFRHPELQPAIRAVLG